MSASVSSADRYRTERAARLAAEATAPASAAGARTATATAPAVEIITATIHPPTADSSGLEMVLVGSGKPGWLVLQHGDPVARIDLSAQADPAALAENFVSQKYASGFISMAGKLGLDKALSSVNGKIFVASVRVTEAFTELRSEARRAVEAELSGVREASNKTLLANVDLAIKAYTSNFIAGGDPLRTALLEQLVKVSNTAPERLVNAIEAAYRENGRALVETLLSKAQEFSSMEPAALTQIKASIDSYGYRDPRPAVIEVAPQPQPLKTARERALEGNVPLMTATIVDDGGSAVGLADRLRQNLAATRGH